MVFYLGTGIPAVEYNKRYRRTIPTNKNTFPKLYVHDVLQHSGSMALFETQEGGVMNHQALSTYRNV